ncbi:high affinity methionine permease [Colletotrichum karsti]|uniref:High affinity methionine permease n=1 Tax=Colletotrichum karsti TaxID=1095194 RepID=A0A9P6HTX9_9PEZI|nr:high affinity methionine permease [Colletotrichum karsti]KAF9869677.1 high affinity methionine permease [Colletotrichum karsti]
MNDFPSSTGIFQEPRNADDNSSNSDAGIVLANIDQNGKGIVTHAPKEGFRLGYFDVSCLVINRMIEWKELSSLSLEVEEIWFTFNTYRKPAYRKNTVLLSTCIFGITFIILGNMAGNSIHFALRVLEAAGVETPSNGAVRGIALAVAFFACFIHATSRRFGILLNNFLAVIKIMIMLLIIISAVVVGAGGFPNTHNVIVDNTSPKNSFKGASSEANGYAQAFLAIIFTFSGFEQPNYVLGEISRPRKKFPIAMGTGVGIVVILYLAVNICYMVVVPAEAQKNENVAQQFFELTFGKLGADSQIGARIFNAFLAISSMGNIIVMTYTAARVKQEIAKEGILPFPKFFASNKDMSLGRLLFWFQKKGWFKSLLQLRWFSPEHHSEKTPVGALVLHLASCIILIFATWNAEPEAAYTALTSFSAYVVNAFIGTFLGLGILILRFRGPPVTPADDDTPTYDQPTSPPTWAELTGKKFRPFLSVIDQIVRPWWLVPTVSWLIITLSIAWFIGFVLVARYIEKKDHRVFVVEKKPEFEAADGSTRSSEAGHRGADLIQVHETVYLSWVGRETLRHRRPTFSDHKEADGCVSEIPASPYAGTDFAAYMSHQKEGTASGAGYPRY